MHTRTVIFSLLLIPSIAPAFFAVMLLFSAFVPTFLCCLPSLPYIPQMFSTNRLLHLSLHFLLSCSLVLSSVALTYSASVLLLPDNSKHTVTKAPWASRSIWYTLTQLVLPCKNLLSIGLWPFFCFKPLPECRQSLTNWSKHVHTYGTVHEKGNGKPWNIDN